MNTLSAGSVLQARYANFKRNQCDDNASIENTVSKAITNNSSIELPAVIDNLIDNKMYRRKFNKLIRDGYLPQLTELAAMAQTKEHPSRWFAKATKTKAAPGYEDQPTYWERSLKYLAKLKEVAKKATQVAERLGVKVNNFIYKQIWNGVNVERWAVAAQEIRHDKPGQSREKHFAWLCLHEKQLAI
jgi:hypothetical protein